MSEYIDRRKFEQLITDRDLRTISTKTIGECLDKSLADVVKVVRCKDCIHNDQCKHRVVMWVEDPINTWHKDIDFCSYGERKDDEKVRD